MDVSIPDVARAIDSYVFSERDRRVLKRSMIDGVSYMDIAEEVGVSPRTVQSVMGRWRPIVMRNL